MRKTVWPAALGLAAFALTSIAGVAAAQDVVPPPDTPVAESPTAPSPPEQTLPLPPASTNPAPAPANYVQFSCDALSQVPEGQVSGPASDLQCETVDLQAGNQPGV